MQAGNRLPPDERELMATPVPTGKRILAVSTSTDQYTTVGYRTGLWLGELTHFYDEATEAGHEVRIASIAGGRIPLDPESLGPLVLKQGGTHRRYADRDFMDLLADSARLVEATEEPYDALFLAGGHGTMFDFPECPALAEVVQRIDREGGIVAAVCHGPAGLLGARRSDGTPFLRGRKVTGFSWREERLAGRAEAVPFRLDRALTEAGAKYSSALRPMASKVVVDERLVTGQNPASARDVAKAVIKLLRSA